MSTELPANCSQCDNHCPREQLRCHRGKAYFERLQRGETEFESQNHLVLLLHQCADIASHRSQMLQRSGENEEQMFSGIPPEERVQLEQILDKLYQGWQKEHAARHADGAGPQGHPGGPHGGGPHDHGDHPDHGRHHGSPSDFKAHPEHDAQSDV